MLEQDQRQSNEKVYRNHTRPVNVGRVTIGGDFPIVVQPMCATKARDTEATLKQVKNYLR